MTKKRDEKLGVNDGPDELEPAKMVVPRDIKTPVAPPDPAITAAQAIELIEGIVKPIKDIAVNVHEIVVGPVAGGLPAGEGLIDRIAEKVAGKIVLLFQTELASQRASLAGLRTRIEELEANQHPGPNGTVPPGGG